MYLTESGYATVGDFAAVYAKKAKKLVKKAPPKPSKKSLVQVIVPRERPPVPRVPPVETTPTGLLSWRSAIMAPSTGTTALSIGPRPEAGIGSGLGDLGGDLDVVVGSTRAWESAATSYFPQNRSLRAKLVPYKSVPSMMSCKPSLSGLGEDSSSTSPWVVALLIAAAVNLSLQAVHAFAAHTKG